METSNLELGSLIQGFTLSCQTEGKSPRTVEWYGCFLARFTIFLKLGKLPTRLDLIVKDYIRGFIRYLQSEAKTPRSGKPLSGSTVQGYVRTLKVFFSWATREGYLQSNIMTGIPVPKTQRKIVNTFNTEQLARLLTICQQNSEGGCRNLTMLLLILDCGLRVTELVSIDLNDINLSEGYIRIRAAKGGNERLVPVGSLTHKTLWKYINHARPQPIMDSITRLFLSAGGLPLTRSGVQQMLRRYGKKAGITGVRCSPHTLRHTFAKNYLLNGSDIFSLQRILGHSSLASVRLYLNLFATDVKKQHQRFSPVDNMVHEPCINNIVRYIRSNSRVSRNPK